MRLNRVGRKQLKIAVAIAAVAVLAVVLVLTVGAAPDDDDPERIVVALVDGEEITAQDVLDMQSAMLRYEGELVELEEVLDQLISQKLVLRQAELAGYSTTIVDAETELLLDLADMGVPLELFLAMLQEDNLSYEEFIEFRRTRLAINSFLDDVIEAPEVTEEEAMEFYELYKDLYRERFPDEEPPPFEEMRSQVFGVLEARNYEYALTLYIKELRDNAEIVYLNSA